MANRYEGDAYVIPRMTRAESERIAAKISQIKRRAERRRMTGIVGLYAIYAMCAILTIWLIRTFAYAVIEGLR